MNDNIDLEEWRRVTPFHEVSARGRVRSYKRRGGGRLFKPRQLKVYRDKYNPYPRVYIGGKIFPVHVLVCFAWHGPKPTPKHEVRHLDGDPTNNCPTNLAWGTHQENMMDEIRLGRDNGAKLRALRAEVAELKAKLLTCRDENVTL